ncbi:MAG: beta-lactamase family protein [Spirochaetes bacterium]|nr:beta-lactamase family protein [Spirochaetota bacterium]
MKKKTILCIVLYINISLLLFSENLNLIDNDKLDVFFDIKIPEQLVKNHIAGAVVAVVKNDKIVFLKGYGYIDKEKKIKTDPNKHLFRVASITKLFTWTAVMQLVEKEKLDLHKNINAYLDFKIPDTFNEPITIFNLLTHTSGLQDKYYDIRPNNIGEISSLGSWLKTHVPQRGFPPGEQIAYSNYGAALAGYIVELISGIPYERYIKENILIPLQMDRTTVLQTIPDHLKNDVANGYFFKNGVYQKAEFELMEDIPAGSMSTTASDLTKFMIAHLNYGKFKDIQILKEITAKTMQKIHFKHDNMLNGMGLGFIGNNHNGQKIIGHTGNIEAFHSIMAILPEHNMGIFISYNTDSAAELTYGSFFKKIINYLFPQEEDVYYEKTKTASSAIKQFLGSYRVNRVSSSSVEKIGELFFSMKVSESNGLLILESILGKQYFIQISKNTFQELNHQETVVFKSINKKLHLFVSSAPTMAFKKHDWYESHTFQLILINICLMLFILIFIISIVKSIKEKQRLAWIISGAIVLLNLSFIIGMLIVSVDLYTMILTGNVFFLKILLVLPLLSVLLLPVSIYCFIQHQKKNDWKLYNKIIYIVSLVNEVVFIWLLFYWNLLGFQF